MTSTWLQESYDPTLQLEPVVHVHAPIIEGLYNRGNLQGMIMGGLFGVTIVITRGIASVVMPDSSNVSIAAFFISMLFVLPLAWVAYRIDRWYAAFKYEKHASEIDRHTLAGRAQLINCHQRIRGKRSWFDVNKWGGPPLICYSCSPTDDVLNVQAQEEIDIFGGARRFEQLQPFRWQMFYLLICIMLGSLTMILSGFPSSWIFSILILVGVAGTGLLFLIWHSQIATIHSVLPIKLTSCMVSAGRVEITRFGSTHVFTREDSILFIEPASPGKIDMNPARLDMEVTLVRRDGRTRRMTFRGAANPCIADLIGRWMYGYELLEELARRVVLVES